MTKEEKIKEAYGNHIIFFKYFIDDDGWLDKLKIGIENIMLIIQLTNEIQCESQINDSHKIRPKSLSGIENNNGWIKINDFNDLPIGWTDCFIFTISGEVKQANLNNDRNSFIYTIEKEITHYQPIEKPEPPIY